MSSINVVFQNAWLTDVSDPTVSLTASFPDRSSTSDLDGRFATRAGGRVVVVTTANRTRTYPLILQWLDDSQLALLESWQGRVLLLRDLAGRRVFGAFLSTPTEDIFQPDGTRHTVTLTLTEVTYQEGV